eukprot:m.78072 g.78072  ORF g.78072 m.78072 type:complete len:366 (+) comp8154_c0_seq2:2354-3451(+)
MGRERLLLLGHCAARRKNSDVDREEERERNRNKDGNAEVVIDNVVAKELSHGADNCRQKRHGKGKEKLKLARQAQPDKDHAHADKDKAHGPNQALALVDFELAVAAAHQRRCGVAHAEHKNGNLGNGLFAEDSHKEHAERVPRRCGHNVALAGARDGVEDAVKEQRLSFGPDAARNVNEDVREENGGENGHSPAVAEEKLICNNADNGVSDVKDIAGIVDWAKRAELVAERAERGIGAHSRDSALVVIAKLRPENLEVVRRRHAHEALRHKAHATSQHVKGLVKCIWDSIGLPAQSLKLHPQRCRRLARLRGCRRLRLQRRCKPIDAVQHSTELLCSQHACRWCVSETAASAAARCGGEKAGRSL